MAGEKRAIREELQDIHRRLERLEERQEPSEESRHHSGCCSGADRRKDGAVDRSGQTMAASGLAVLRVRSSIDASRNDNGFLGCVYSRYSETSNNTVTSHWT